MTFRSKTLLTVVCLGLVGAFGTAAAQPGTGKVDVDAASSTPPGDQVAVTDGYIKKIEASAKRVRHLLDEARRNKDVVKATCLSDMLAQIEVALKGVRDRSASLKAAAARGDNDVRNHEFGVATNLKKRADQLDAQANQCIGEELGFPGETKTTYAIDPNIAPDDQGGGGENPPTYVPPLPASPFN